MFDRDDKLEVPKRVFIFLVAALALTFLALMFVLGMMVGDGEEASLVPATPEARADDASVEDSGLGVPLQVFPTEGPSPLVSGVPTEQPDLVATHVATPRATRVATPTARQVSRSRRGYADCLALTYRAVKIASEDLSFRINDSSRSVSSVIGEGNRVMNYVGDHCRPLAPEPEESRASVLRCLPDALRTYYQWHLPDGNDSGKRPLAAQYALTVCQPSADR